MSYVIVGVDAKEPLLLSGHEGRAKVKIRSPSPVTSPYMSKKFSSGTKKIHTNIKTLLFIC